MFGVSGDYDETTAILALKYWLAKAYIVWSAGDTVALKVHFCTRARSVYPPDAAGMAVLRGSTRWTVAELADVEPPAAAAASAAPNAKAPIFKLVS